MKLKISGKKVELPAPAQGWTLTTRPGGWIVAVAPDGRRRRIALHEARGRVSASLGGVLYQAELQQEQRGGAGGGGDSDLIAQFPGKVRKILVTEGQAVAEGTPLVLVEAMKMEFSIRAPFVGTVTRVLVKEGQQLQPGDRFVELAPQAAQELAPPEAAK